MDVIAAPNVVIIPTMELADLGSCMDQIAENLLYTPAHLTDHDYFDVRPKLRQRKCRNMKQLKITELKAIFNCKTCGYRTMNRDILYQHSCTKNTKNILQENPTKMITAGFEKHPKFNNSTKNLANLKLHKGTHIEDIRQKCTDSDATKNCINILYNCPKCSYTSKSPASLKVHMHIHSRGTPYKCTECSYSAKDLKELIKHYDTTKNLRCICGYTAHVKQRMIAHKRLHTGEKPFLCGICNFATADRSALQKHLKRH